MWGPKGSSQQRSGCSWGPRENQLFADGKSLITDHWSGSKPGFSSLILSFQELRRLERKVSKLAKTLRKLGYSDLIDDAEGQDQGNNSGADNKTDADVNNCQARPLTP